MHLKYAHTTRIMDNDTHIGDNFTTNIEDTHTTNIKDNHIEDIFTTNKEE